MFVLWCDVGPLADPKAALGPTKGDKMRKQIIAATMAALVFLLSGCGAGLKHVFSDKPEVQGVTVSPEASQLVVDYWPNGAWPEVFGYTIIPPTELHPKSERIEIAIQLDGGVDTTAGKAFFLFAISPPEWWGGYSPIKPNLPYYFRITIRKDDGQQKTELWEYAFPGPARRVG